MSQPKGPLLITSNAKKTPPSPSGRRKVLEITSGDSPSPTGFDKRITLRTYILCSFQQALIEVQDYPAYSKVLLNN